MVILAFIVAVWLACAFVSTGITVAFFQRSFPQISKESYREDLGNAIFFALVFGPVWLFISLCLSGFCQYGWTLRPPK